MGYTNEIQDNNKLQDIHDLENRRMQCVYNPVNLFFCENKWR